MENTAKVTNSFNRPNLFYEVRQRRKDSVREIANWINTHHRGKTGIIYRSSREGTEIMAKKLKFEHQIEAKHFHAGKDERNKTETQQAWQEGRLKVVVATVCFDSCVVCLVGLYSTSRSLSVWVSTSQMVCCFFEMRVSSLIFMSCEVRFVIHNDVPGSLDA